MNSLIHKIVWAAFLFFSQGIAFSQISPGELAKVHAHLEGMSNCTKCHTLGSKVSNDKCLVCHTEIKERLVKQKGYHASTEVRGKACASCHNDHHGRNFQIIRFNPAGFNHSVTGYPLEGAHARKSCKDCHISRFITDKKLKSKPHTYLGLNRECLSCHADFHQQTLSRNCSACHNMESFKPATGFNHAKTSFPLVGKHLMLDCQLCHPKETRSGQPFIKFTGISHSNCTSCHTDVHQNKFGQNCRLCHSENSFHQIKNNSVFDHSKTNFMLEGKHAGVSCTACHKKKITDPIKHDNCADCHLDYHRGQFAKSGSSPDCRKCHTVNGFSPSLFSITDHNAGTFRLKGAHLAVACFECHRKQDSWNFRNIGNRCIDCHQNVHGNSISRSYFPDENCTACHSEKNWTNVQFDHSKTNFQLEGKHQSAACRQCHTSKDKTAVHGFIFAGLQNNCSSCHADSHFRQFEVNGQTDCKRCHDSFTWKASKFNHNLTAFKLDGKHENLSCSACHKKSDNEKYIVYKIKKFKCEDCH